MDEYTLVSTDPFSLKHFLLTIVYSVTEKPIAFSIYSSTENNNNNNKENKQRRWKKKKKLEFFLPAQKWQVAAAKKVKPQENNLNKDSIISWACIIVKCANSSWKVHLVEKEIIKVSRKYLY